MAVPRVVRYAGQGFVGQYIHLGGKLGVMVEFSGVTPEVAAARRVPDARQGNRDADRGREPELRRRAASVPADVLDKEKRDLPCADGELGQAGERDREDRRGQARQLLQRRWCCPTRSRSAIRRCRCSRCSPRRRRRSARRSSVTRFARLKVGEAAERRAARCQGHNLCALGSVPSDL